MVAVTESTPSGRHPKSPRLLRGGVVGRESHMSKPALHEWKKWISEALRHRGASDGDHSLALR